MEFSISYAFFSLFFFQESPFVGLENNVPNSLINPILQLCYALVPLRDQALLSQLSPFHYQEAHQGEESYSFLVLIICEAEQSTIHF